MEKIMDLKSIFNQFSSASNASGQVGSGISDSLGKLSSSLPSGLAGGALAGGILSLLMTSKSARKVAGTAATVGGTALLGGLAYKAYKNWQSSQQEQVPVSPNSFTSPELLEAGFQLTLIKAMIAAARADGLIDANEHKRIFDAVYEMKLDNETRALVLDMVRQPYTIAEIAHGAETFEQKTEVYLVSCMIIDIDHPGERDWLNSLAKALGLPPELAAQLEMQVSRQLAAA
jgi:uncharacterized membrane protein YebE (DUF533 family)